MDREILVNLEAKSKSVIQYWLNPWILNAVKNWPTIQMLIKSGRAFSITKATKANIEPALITGSGPSLDSYSFQYHRLREGDLPQTAPTVFASLSNASNYLANNIVPKYICVVDAAAGLADMNFPKKMELLLEDSFLICPPTVSPKILDRWMGKFLFFRPMQPGNEFVMNILPIMYSEMYEHKNMRDRLFVEQFPLAFMNAGCVVNSMLAAATYLGYEPLYLNGCDFGFPQGRQGCIRYKLNPRNMTWKVEDKQDSITTDQVRRLSNNNILTTEEHLNYKMNFYLIWGATKAKVYNLSSCSILDNTVPVVSPEQMFENNHNLWADYPMNTEDLPEYCQKLAKEMGLIDPKDKIEASKPKLSGPIHSGPWATTAPVQTIELPPEVIEKIKKGEKK